MSIELTKEKVKNNSKEDKDNYILTYKEQRALKSDCVNVDGLYYLKTDSNLTIDFVTGKYIDKRNCLQFFTKLDNRGFPDINQPSYSRYLKKDNLIYVICKDTGNCYFHGYEILFNAGYVECLETGQFFHSSISSKAKLTKTGRYRKINAIKRYNKADMQYNLKYGLDSSTYSISEGKRYSLGFELETIRGYLPSYLDELLNYESVHDGSLRDEAGNIYGGEYVTGVLKGDMGFRQLKLLCNELSKRCKINKQCGVHIHCGDIDFNKEFVVYIYYLARKLEDELFTMLPHSRRNNEYCRKLKPIAINLTKKFKDNEDYLDYIDDIYDKIVLYVSHQDRLDPTILNKKNDHPLGNKCGYDHNTARYAWLNFVPTLFNTRGNEVYTLEIRNMQGSLNYMKIRNWALIFMSMIYVVENHKSFLRNTKDFDLSDIIRISYNKKADELIKYIQNRKDKFSTKEGSSLTEQMEYDEETNDGKINLKSL